MCGRKQYFYYYRGAEVKKPMFCFVENNKGHENVSWTFLPLNHQKKLVVHSFFIAI